MSSFWKLVPPGWFAYAEWVDNDGDGWGDNGPADNGGGGGGGDDDDSDGDGGDDGAAEREQEQDRERERERAEEERKRAEEEERKRREEEERQRQIDEQQRQIEEERKRQEEEQRRQQEEESARQAAQDPNQVSGADPEAGVPELRADTETDLDREHEEYMRKAEEDWENRHGLSTDNPDEMQTWVAAEQQRQRENREPGREYTPTAPPPIKVAQTTSPLFSTSGLQTAAPETYTETTPDPRPPEETGPRNVASDPAPMPTPRPTDPAVPQVAATAAATAVTQSGGTPEQAGQAAEAAARTAYDKQTLAQQSSWTRAAFRSQYGANAEAEWQRQHQAELERNQRLYGASEPTAGTAPVAGAPAGTAAAPNRRIGATPAPTPGLDARYGITSAAPATVPAPTLSANPTTASTAAPVAQDGKQTATGILPGAPVAAPTTLSPTRTTPPPGTTAATLPPGTDASTPPRGGAPLLPPRLPVPAPASNYPEERVPPPAASRTTVPTPADLDADGGARIPAAGLERDDDVLTITRPPTSEASYPPRQVSRAEWNTGAYSPDIWTVQNAEANPARSVQTPTDQSGFEADQGPRESPQPNYPLPAGDGSELRPDPGTGRRGTAPPSPTGYSQTLTGPEGTFTRLRNEEEYITDANGVQIPQASTGNGYVTEQMASTDTSISSPPTDVDPVAAAIDNPEPITALATLAANPGEDAQQNSYHITQGIAALLRGDSAGAWAEPYLNDVGRLAWAKEERANGRVSDPRDAPVEYIEKFKDGVAGSDERVPLVKELNQQMINIAAERTPTGQPFRWQEVYGANGDKGLISRQVTAVDCGPNAFSTILRSRGYNADPAAAFTFAKQNGYHSGSQFNGPAAYARMLKQEAGLDSEQVGLNDQGWSRVDQELVEGRPVTLSSPGHYWVVTAKDEQGRYYAGATSLRGNPEWMPRSGFSYGGVANTAILARGDVDPNSRAVKAMGIPPPPPMGGGAGPGTGASNRALLSGQTEYQAPAQRATARVRQGMQQQSESLQTRTLSDQQTDPRELQAANEDLWSDNQPARHALMTEYQEKPKEERRAIFDDAIEQGLDAEGITDPDLRARWKQTMTAVTTGDGLAPGVPAEDPDLNPYMISGEFAGRPSKANVSSALGYFQLIHSTPRGDDYAFQGYLPAEYESPYHPTGQVRQFIRVVNADANFRGNPDAVIAAKNRDKHYNLVVSKRSRY